MKTSDSNLETAKEVSSDEALEKSHLADFLIKNSQDVREMIFSEMSLDMTRDACIEKALEEGREIGRKKGREIGRKEEEDKWQRIVADKDAVIAELRAQLSKSRGAK